MGTQYISTTDTAKLIRKVLKESFPGIKFYVRSDCYSMGSSIHIKWTDGPTESQVNSIVSFFTGSTFDGITDCTDYINRDLENGQVVHFEPDHVFARRDLSDDLLSQAILNVESQCIVEKKITPEDFRNGAASRIFIKYLCESSDIIISREAKSISLAPTQFSKTLAMYSPMSSELAA